MDYYYNLANSKNKSNIKKSNEKCLHECNDWIKCIIKKTNNVKYNNYCNDYFTKYLECVDKNNK
jgi:hypothetical protein